MSAEHDAAEAAVETVAKTAVTRTAEANAEYAIQCEGLRVRYPRSREDALAQVNLNIPRDAFCGLFGRNGAGKTTLMALLAGFRRPSEGTLRIFGEEPYENPRIAPKVAFVYQKNTADDMLNAYKPKEYLRLARRFRPQWDEDYAQHLFKRFDVPLKKTLAKMSQGQRAAFRCTMGIASRAPLTIFDEAYLGMDTVYRHVFIEELLADYLAYPRTIVFSTHSIAEMEKLFSEALILDGGRVLVHDDADRLREGGLALEQLFLSLTMKEGECYER